jgi:putative DNA primase/helicase
MGNDVMLDHLNTLKKLDQWVLWKHEEVNGRKTKVPYSITGYKAQSDNARTWSSYANVIQRLNGYAGIGIMFANNLCGIDLDHHEDGQNLYIDDAGRLTSDAQFWIDSLPTYWEISPSGNGLHALALGVLPEGRRQDDKQGIALYDKGRFFTVTGRHIEGTPADVANIQDEINVMYRWTFGDGKKAIQTGAINNNPLPDEDFDLRIIALIMNNEKFNAIWKGDFSAYQKDHSRADLALAGFVMRATSNNLMWADRVMRLWPHFRQEKWDTRHFSNGDTYGLRTLLMAASDMVVSDQPAPTSEDNPIDIIRPVFLRTDSGNGERLAFRHSRTLKYHEAVGWLHWEERYWRADDTGEIMRRARETARSIFEEAKYAGNDETATAVAKWATASLSNSKLTAMIKQTESQISIIVTPDQFDRNPMLLNVQNGMIDLNNGKLLPHDPDRLITKITHVDYLPDAPCPLWLSFLDRIMAGNSQMISFLQRAIGYSLTGDISEQCLFMSYGTGANGKSVFNDTILTMLGDFGQAAEFSTFLSHTQDGIRNDIARLVGSRFVSSLEAGEGRKLSEVIVKSLTGGDAVTARFLHKELFTFRPQFKLWLATNHKPNISGTDYAIWRRIRLIPFMVTIPGPERDLHLVEKLRNELSGILSWSVRGCLEWQRQGLGTPDEVLQATEEYRTDMDSLAAFLRDCCKVDRMLLAQSGVLHAAYNAYSGEKTNPREFKALMIEHGYKLEHTRNGSAWRGVGMIDMFDKQTENIEL